MLLTRLVESEVSPLNAESEASDYWSMAMVNNSFMSSHR